MGIREQAEADLGAILEDSTYGAGWPITLVAPDGTESSGLIGYTSDISQLIDPLTGQAVSGRLATAALRISSVTTTLPGLGLPVAIADASSNPWVMRFDDILGNAYSFKIVKSMPDRALGVITFELEAYND